jgi:hypothetical protein
MLDWTRILKPKDIEHREWANRFQAIAGRSLAGRHVRYFVIYSKSDGVLRLFP